MTEVETCARSLNLPHGQTRSRPAQMRTKKMIENGVVTFCVDSIALFATPLIFKYFQEVSVSDFGALFLHFPEHLILGDATLVNTTKIQGLGCCLHCSSISVTTHEACVAKGKTPVNSV